MRATRVHEDAAEQDGLECTHARARTAMRTTWIQDLQFSNFLSFIFLSAMVAEAASVADACVADA